MTNYYTCADCVNHYCNIECGYNCSICNNNNTCDLSTQYQNQSPCRGRCKFKGTLVYCYDKACENNFIYILKDDND